jgi:hypothetical protein
MASPAIRARSAQDALAYAEQTFAPEMVGRIRELVPPASMAFIDALSTNAWVPVEHDRWLPRAIVQAYGRERAFAMWRSFIPSHIESPLLGPMFKTAARLFGVNPGTVAWLVPKGFGNVYRDVATPRLIERRDGYAEFALDDIHPEVCAIPEYIVCFHATFQGLVDVTSRERPATLEAEFDADERRMLFRVDW